MSKLSKEQQKALDLAAISGALRRLPGGYWVGEETPWFGNLGLIHVPEDQWVGTQTVRACAKRELMVIDSYYRARITPAGFALAAPVAP